MKLIKREYIEKEIIKYNLEIYKEDILFIYDCWTYQKQCDNLKSKVEILLENIFKHPVYGETMIPLKFLKSTLGVFLLAVYVEAPKELSIIDLANIIGCTKQNLYDHISKGNLIIEKVGRENYITQTEAERFIKNYK
ncbi:MAG: hypothetical protein AB7V16_11390 [Vulcanibacillus sp.]